MTKRICTALLSLLFLAPLCHASAITIVFDHPTEIGFPGSTLSFTANLTNNTNQMIELGAANVTLGGLFGVDTTPFLFGPPVVGPFGSTGHFEIFTVSIPSNASGFQNGVLSITDINDNLIGLNTFSVVVAPEPSTRFMLLMACCGGVWYLRAQKRSLLRR